MSQSDHANFAAELQQDLAGRGIDDPNARGLLLVDAVRRLIARIGNVGPEIKKAILEAALKIYDSINTPVPDAIESPIKQLLRPTVEDMLKHVLGLDS